MNTEFNDGITIASIELYDISGKQIRIELSDENNLKVSGLADGIYMLSLFTEHRVEITKK